MGSKVPVARTQTAQAQVVYKIMPRAMWNDAVQNSTFFGSPDDLRDGFIHFSLGHQVPSTLEKHFHGQTDLVLIAVPTASLGNGLRWESSRGNDIFPHLYASLPTSSAVWTRTIDLDANGVPKCDPAWLTC